MYNHPNKALFSVMNYYDFCVQLVLGAYELLQLWIQTFEFSPSEPDQKVIVSTERLAHVKSLSKPMTVVCTAFCILHEWAFDYNEQERLQNKGPVHRPQPFMPKFYTNLIFLVRNDKICCYFWSRLEDFKSIFSSNIR